MYLKLVHVHENLWWNNFLIFLSPAQIDPEKIIEYPGFTVPPAEGVKDVSVIILLFLTFYTGYMLW